MLIKHYYPSMPINTCNVWFGEQKSHLIYEHSSSLKYKYLKPSNKPRSVNWI